MSEREVNQQPTTYEQALYYLDLGMSIIPINATTKKPLTEWKEFQERHAEPIEVANWISQFGTKLRLGLVTGAISGVIVADGDTPEAVAWVNAHLPYTTLGTKTTRGRHFYFRHPGWRVPNSASDLAKGLDVRGDGGYVGLPTPGHDNYTWDGDLANEWAIMGDWPAWPYRSKGGNLSVIDFQSVKASRQGPALPSDAAPGRRNMTMTEIAGRGFHYGDDEATVLALCLAINSGWSSPMDEKEVETTVASVYRLHQINHRDEIRTEVGLPAVETSTAEPKPEGLPAELLNVGGVLGSLMAYAEASSPYHHPVFALGAALVTLGGILGRRIATPSGLRTNLYILAAGPTGTGKEAARQAMVRALRVAGMDAIIGPEQFASPAAIVKSLVGHPICVAYLDEVGHQFKAARREGSHAAGILTTFTKLFSQAASQYLGDAYGATDREKVIIRQPHLCVYGTSVPGRVFDSLGPDDVSDGFLPRWIVWEVDGEKPPRKRGLQMDVPFALVEQLQALAAIPIGTMRGEEAVHPNEMKSGEPSEPMVIPVHEDAQACLDAYEEECRLEQNAIRRANPMRAGVLNRAPEHAAKLAMIRAVSDGCGAQPVHLEHAQWAVAVIKSTVSTMAVSISDRVAVNDWDSQVQKIQAAIAAAGEDGLSQRGICRAVRGLRVDEVDESLHLLVTRGDVMTFVPERSTVNGAKGRPPAARWRSV